MTIEINQSESVEQLDDALVAVVPPPGTFPEEIKFPALRNAYRASVAVPALKAYAERSGTEGEPLHALVGDLLSDLMHLVDLFVVDPEDEDRSEVQSFDELLARAGRRYAEERAGE